MTQTNVVRISDIRQYKKYAPRKVTVLLGQDEQSYTFRLYWHSQMDLIVAKFICSYKTELLVSTDEYDTISNHLKIEFGVQQLLCVRICT